LSILLADGDEGYAGSLSRLLDSDGHTVRIVPDGMTALRMAFDDPPDVMILELALAGMDGWEIAERLQRRGFGKPTFFIAYTVRGAEADRRRSAEAGINLHLVKSGNTHLLRAVLRRFYRVVMPGLVPPEEGTEGEDGGVSGVAPVPFVVRNLDNPTDPSLS
jgi:DNA-binding response OmpR family regulator